MALWEEFISLEETSSSLVPILKALLRSREELNAIYTLTGLEAQRVVDTINRAINSPQLTEPLRKGALKVLCKLCGLCRLLPTECVLGDGLVETGIQIGSGGFADVWQGTYGGTQVAIKRLRACEKDDFAKIYKRFCTEVVIWRKLAHPNILPLLGISTNGGNLCMISRLMSHGTIMAYLSTRPSANRLMLLADVGGGLSYLHGSDLVHGDLKGANILVDDEGVPRIADFGLMLIMKDTDTLLDTHTSVGGIGTPRWSAPELLDPPVFGFERCRPSKESDCYSFGMTIYEILTGKLPFHDLRTDAVMMRIVRGIRPDRPHHSHAIGFIDPVWAIVEECWKENSCLRPDAPIVVECLTAAAAQWTPTPPLDDPRAGDESETFSLVSLYDSEYTQVSNDITPRDVNCGREDEGKDKTVAPAYYENTVAENFHLLAQRFYGSYQRSRKLEDLYWVIEHEKEAVFRSFPTHPGRLRHLICLAGYYYERHEISQDPQDIKLSIEKSSDVEQRTTADDPIRPDVLLILAKAHHLYYCRYLQPENLESAIKYCSEAVTLCPIDHPFRVETLLILSAALYDRYQTTPSLGNFQLPRSDLDNAISNSIAAIDLLQSGDPRLPDSRTKLSTFLFARYQRQKNLCDLQQSVHQARLASIDHISEKQPEALTHLGHLLTYLSHDPKTLTEIAQCSRKALELLPPDDHQCTGAIHNLITASHRMYVTLNSTAHLDEAIDYNRRFLRLLPYRSEPWYSQLKLHRNLLEYRLNEKQFEVDFGEMADVTREIAARELQSHYVYRCPPQPSTRPPPTPDTPQSGSPTARPFEYRPPQNWSPRPYYYDDSAVSIAGSDSTAPGSVETEDYGGGSESSLVGHALNLSFVEPNPNRYYTSRG